MAFRTILTVTGPNRDNDDLETAARLAAAADAHLSVFVLALAAAPPVSEFGVGASTVWLEQRQSDVGGLDARVKAVTAWLAGRGIRGDVAEDYPDLGRADEVIGRRARFADLTVVGPDMLDGTALAGKIVEGALFDSGRPLLVVPKGASPTLSPGRVVVAWDHRVEASRAAREALDMLAGAQDVRLVLVDPVRDETAHGEEPGADAAAWLARHGAKVSVDRLPGMGDGVASTLARHAADVGADMLVMGAYGHSRLRERIFGGVTRSMLRDPPLPVFLAR